MSLLLQSLDFVLLEARHSPLSWKAVQVFMSSSPSIVRTVRQINKSGSNDENSTWALARYAQCEQFLDMLELGKVSRDCPDVTDSDIAPLRLHGVMF